LRRACSSPRPPCSRLRSEIGGVVTYQHVAPVQENGQQLPPCAYRAPGFGEQGLEHRVLLVRTASPENDDRDQLHIEGRVGNRLADQTCQQAGVTAAITGSAGKAAVTVEEKKGTGQTAFAQDDRCLGARQAGTPRLLEEYQQIRQVLVLQDITNRLGRVEMQVLRVLGEDCRPHPDIQQAPRQWDEPVGEFEAFSHDCPVRPCRFAYSSSTTLCCAARCCCVTGGTWA
jgi:hypothetical protein